MLEYKQEFEKYFESHMDEIVASLGEIIGIESVGTLDSSVKPFGQGSEKALKWGEDFLKSLGMKTCNADNYAVHGDFKEGEPVLAVLSHLDTVPAGEGWSYDPFKLTCKDGILYGKVLGIRSLISYEGTSVKELVEDFHTAIDSYLDLCKDNGISPETPYKGSFNVRISPELLTAAAEAVAEIGDEGSLDVLETLGEAVVDMDSEITDVIDDCIDTLNVSIHMGLYDEDAAGNKKSKHVRAALDNAIEAAKDQCLSVLEEKIPHDLEDDEPIDIEDEDECECGEHHHHHDHEHHHHHHDNPLEGMDLSRFRILDDLEAYEAAADRDADEDELWAEFEDMAEEDLDAESLRDFINKLEKRKK